MKGDEFWAKQKLAMAKEKRKRDKKRGLSN